MATISPETRIGTVALKVANLEKELEFYREVVGLELLSLADTVASLGAGTRPLLTLHAAPGARRVQRTAGLYHFAILLPTRRDLARALDQLLKSGYPLEGAADHLVSEAIYLRDPEGNGIEIYRDRPRTEWHDGRGKIRMATLPLDLHGLRGEMSASTAGSNGLPGSARIGHIHLHVSDLQEAEHFYCEILGFERVTRYGASAAFVSAGGYHHHVGLNTWAGEGAPPPPQDATGLLRFEIALPNTDSLEIVLRNLSASSISFVETPQGVLLGDPSQNGIALAVAGSVD
jgi:catechol 2,3-dioxygenase